MDSFSFPQDSSNGFSSSAQQRNRPAASPDLKEHEQGLAVENSQKLESLFQLANFYVVSTFTSPDGKSAILADKIGLCYIFKNRLSSSDELKIVYTPTGSFNLSDSHQAVNNLPSNTFLPHTDNNSDFRVFHSLVRKWLQGLKDDMEEPLLALFTFKDNLLDSVDHIFCNLFALVNPITNIFSHCQVKVLQIHID
ncbi:unnamed protein product [Lupinus luteus]|uniref:CCZ1/INTU/HSP4 first Longin domain-containing protein n=1 Tax=Lupinus luteus TaxID=3873 RepID=A0AAV1XVY3_LUPLU